jgi:hypothetical protein
MWKEHNKQMAIEWQVPDSRQLLAIHQFNLDHWVVEGPAELSIEAAGGVVDALAGGATIWYKPDIFSGDLLVQLEIMPIPPPGKNNLNFIFNATEADGSDILNSSARRTGHYPEYHKFPNYIFTFVGPKPDEGHTRMRRNPGFELMSENINLRAELGREYNIAIAVRRGHIQAAIDGVLIHDVTDPTPLESGRIGLRTWQTKLLWKKLYVGALSI